MNMMAKTAFLPIASESHDQMSLPNPLKIEAIASTVPAVMAKALSWSGVGCPSIVLRNTSCAMGDNWDINPIPADTLRKSMSHNVHHCLVFTATLKGTESAADL